MAKKQFAVIGLGRFGKSVARSLVETGNEVLGIDIDEETVQNFLESVSHAVQADATDEKTLRALGLQDFDSVIVAIGEDMQASVLITLILKEMGIKNLLAKALNESHGKVLERVGADNVVYPERDMGVRVARNLAGHIILDYLELDPSSSIIEIKTPKWMIGKTLGQLELRKKYGISIIGISRKGVLNINPGPNDQLDSGDLLAVLGRNEDLDKLESM